MFNLIKTVHAAADIPLGNIEGTGVYQTGLNDSTVKSGVGDLLSNIITTLTVVGGLAFIIYFAIGALKWIIAGGDKGKVAESQSQMTQAAIGLIAIVAAYFIAGIVGGVLGLDLLNPMKVLFPSSSSPLLPVQAI